MPISSLNQSASVRRAERKAVSPEVMGQAMTPRMARIIPTPFMVIVLISKTVFAPPPPSSLMVAPPSRVQAAEAQIRAMMPSATMAP